MDEKLRPILEPIFAEIADGRTGELGSPYGALAYAYIRVSTSGQAEEGRTGLPRQLSNIHELACNLNLRIPFRLLYGDDHTGFEFKDRPDLQRLMADISDEEHRESDHLLMEYLDRLSRNAKWHQGYLLELFEQQGIAVRFWKEFHSEIERAVMGAISEQGMRHEIERMTEGMRLKAKSGRITARTPSYGFLFVDSKGRPATDVTSNYRQDSHYALDPDQAPIMKEIYYRIVGGESLFDVCDDLERRGVPTPKASKHWSSGNVSKMLKNTVYKGEYAANRYYFQNEWSERSQKMVNRQRQRPKEEWIIVPVPAIVSPEVWEEAQKALKRNIKKSTRNAKKACLLQGFIYCACCGHLYNAGGSSGPIVDGKRTRRFYICGSYNGTRTVREIYYCKSPVVYSDEIDHHVWDSICELITDPEILISCLEEEYDNFKKGELNHQLKYLDKQLNKCHKEEAQWDRAYGEGIFSLEEYREKKEAVRGRILALQVEWEKIVENIELVETFERKREIVYEHLKKLKQAGYAPDIPFKDKRTILAMFIDRVVIDSKEKWYRLEGLIEGVYQYEEKSLPQRGQETGSAAKFTSTSAP